MSHLLIKSIVSVCSAHPFLSPHKICHLMKLAVLISSSHAFFFLVLNTRTELPLLIILFSTSIYVRPLYVTVISIEGFFYWCCTSSQTCIRHPESWFFKDKTYFSLLSVSSAPNLSVEAISRHIGARSYWNYSLAV